jgi:prepilin-type N-terminal cleavage/methylation domain-containing protein
MLSRLPIVPLRARRGFTLTELLVVLLVIAIVAGIVVAGVQGVLSRQEDRNNVARLQVLQTMLENYERTAGQAGSGSASSGIIPEGQGYTMTAGLDIGGSNNDWEGNADLREALEAFIRSGTVDNPVSRTQRVIGRLLTIPENQKILEDNPDLFRYDFSFGYRGTNDIIIDTDSDGDGVGDNSGLQGTAIDTQPPDRTTHRGSLTVPLPVDDRGKMILFVGEGGMGSASNSRQRIEYEDWEWWLNRDSGGTRPMIVARDGGCFFVAAGRSGKFINGDDNVFSVEVAGYYPATGELSP